MTNTTRQVTRLRVTDAAATVRARKQEVARPAAYCVTAEQAAERLADAMAALRVAVEACPDHTAPINLGA